jgi:hypothetical protein
MIRMGTAIVYKAVVTLKGLGYNPHMTNVAQKLIESFEALEALLETEQQRFWLSFFVVSLTPPTRLCPTRI